MYNKTTLKFFKQTEFIFIYKFSYVYIYITHYLDDTSDVKISEHISALTHVGTTNIRCRKQIEKHK